MSSIQRFKAQVKYSLSLVKRLRLSNPDAFLHRCVGVIHVGANEGQERAEYARKGLHVIWIEPIPEVFEKLKSNICSLSKQKAYQYLITEYDGVEYDLHIASNSGASSSILRFSRHSELWPEVKMERSIRVIGQSLTHFVNEQDIDLKRYDALILDTQGSELAILKGCGSTIKNFSFIKIEAPDFEAYDGCCRLEEIDLFMREAGFYEYARNRFASKRGVGNYYDVVYIRGKGQVDQ